MASTYCIKKGHAFVQTGFAQSGDDVVHITHKNQTTKHKGEPLLAKKTQGGEGKYEWEQPTGTVSFILRLLLQQLDVSLVEDALIKKCKDNLTKAEAHEMVQKVINRYEPEYIQPYAIQQINKQQMQEEVTTYTIPGQQPKHFDSLDVNNRINQMGPPIFMFSFPPLM